MIYFSFPRDIAFDFCEVNKISNKTNGLKEILLFFDVTFPIA